MEQKFFPFCPHKLISLADMIKYTLEKVLGFRDHLAFYEKSVHRQEPYSQEQWEAKLKRIARFIQKLSDESSFLGFNATVGRCNIFIRSLNNAAKEVDLAGHKVKLDNFTPQEVVREIKGISETFDNELAEKHFAFIPADKEQYFEQEKLFENEIYDKFDDARQDLKDAGNCLAVDLNTGAVFHLMRVAECGMRKLAAHVRPRYKLPLEYCDWGGLIKPMAKKIGKQEQARRGPKKSKQLDFYSRCLSDCKSFIETRNRVSHNREPFSDKEAHAIFDRVKAFMHHLVKL